MVRIEAQVRVAAPLERVWEIFTDLACWGDWSTVLTGVEARGEACLMVGGRFRCCLRPYALPIFFEAVVEEVVPLRKILWVGGRYGVRGRHEFLFEADGGGTLLISREVLTGLPTAFGGVFLPVGKLRRLTVAFLEDLARGAEASSAAVAGAPAAPTVGPPAGPPVTS